MFKCGPSRRRVFESDQGVSFGAVERAASAHAQGCGGCDARGLADGGFEAFRKGALWDALPGKTSYRMLTQREYEKLLAHLLKLGGASRARHWREHDARIAQREAAGGGDAHRARFALQGQCKRLAGAFPNGEAGAWAYAVELLKGIHRATPETATARELWQTLYTLKSRVRAMAAKTDSVAGAAACHTDTRGGGAQGRRAPPRGVRADCGVSRGAEEVAG